MSKLGSIGRERCIGCRTAQDYLVRGGACDGTRILEVDGNRCTLRKTHVDTTFDKACAWRLEVAFDDDGDAAENGN
jgi:hypothetical protein